MKAVLCTHFGPPEQLELADVAPPHAAPGEAVVRVKAAALNFFDTLIVAGKYQQKPPFPFSPVAEFAGIVESIGTGVTEVAPGDRVMTFLGWGAAREAIAAPAQQLIKIPEQLDFDRAAGLCITYGTSLYALRERAQLKAGETLAVLGASGGAGLAAVELGKLMGARVIACASSDEKLAFAREHGADEIVNYSNENLRDAFRRLGHDFAVGVRHHPDQDCGRCRFRPGRRQGRVQHRPDAVIEALIPLTDLSGTWVVNVHKSTFGSFAVPTVDSLVIKRVGSVYELDVTSDMGGDVVEHFTYPVPIHDSATAIDLPDGSRMHTTFTHHRDTVTFATEISAQGTPVARQRGLMYPSADGRTLTRDVTITPLSGASRAPIHVKLVYDKRN